MSDVLTQHASGLGPIDETLLIDEGKTYQLSSVTLKVSVAPTTSENLTVTWQAAAGDDYDVLLYVIDLSNLGATSIVWQPDQPLYLVGGDSVKVAWPNTDGYRWGLEYSALRVHP